MMEAWLIADREKLREYYGRGFHEKSLPANANVELVDKDVLERSLNAATRSTRKGPYHKLHHGPEILERIRADVVRNKAPYCARLLDTLKAEVERA
jgi:hypothetical protein